MVQKNGAAAAAKLKLILAMLIFGTIGIFVRNIGLPSSLIAVCRGYVGMLFLALVLVLRWQKPDIKAIRRNFLMLVISGGLIGLNWIALFEAYNYTTVTTATLCYYLAPVFVTLASPFVLQEKLTGKKLLCVAVALFGASWASQQFAEPVAQWLAPVLEEKIQEYMPQEQASLQDMLQEFNFSGDALQQKIDEIMQNVSDTGATVFDAATESISLSIASALVFVAAFLVLLLVMWLLMLPLKALVKLPGINFANRLGGAALGLVIGALLLFLAVWAMLRFDIFLTPELVEDTYLLRFFANNSPLSLIKALQ